MNTYRIAYKNNNLIAINIDGKDGISTIQSLKENGYIIATCLIEANSTTEAIEFYLDTKMEHTDPSRKLQNYEPPEEQAKNSTMWDIFLVLFVIAMIIVSEM